MHGPPANPFGHRLREWRLARRLSQLALALDAGISARHLSCLETGRAHPSRAMVARLAEVLCMPLRERNALLVSAGFAARHPETPLATPALGPVRRAIEAMLAQQEPYPAFLLDRHWTVRMANRAAMRVNRFLLGGRDSRHDNMLRQVFDPDDLRPAVANWDEVAGGLLRHLQSEVAANPADVAGRALLDEVLASGNVPARWRLRDVEAAPSPLLATVFRRGRHELRFFSTITAFGTPRDVTLEDVHLESCHPADDATIALCRRLAAEDTADDGAPGAADVAGAGADQDAAQAQSRNAAIAGVSARDRSRVSQ